MSDSVEAVPTYLEKLIPGQSHAESTAMLGRGSLVFLGGMAMAAASFFVERAVVRAIRKV
jgi:hypothetical protein